MTACTYCDAPATTRDHVPPRGLFSRPLPQLITVPSCAQCNNGAHLDDQYFRDMVLFYRGVATNPQAAPVIDRMIDRIKGPKSQRYHTHLFNNLRNIVSSQGTLLANGTPAIAVDQARMDRVAKRVLRGLFLESMGRRLDRDATIEVSTNPHSVACEQAKSEQMLQGGECRTIRDGEFWFAHKVTTDNAHASLWLLVFFDAYACLGFIREETASPSTAGNRGA